MKQFLICCCFLFISANIFSYPISPRPLRKLVMESQYIVWGKVIETGETKQTKKNENIWERDYALVVITEQLKGAINQDTIKIYFCRGMICPAPGILYEDESVLIFLDKAEKREGYQIHALSYGVKHELTEEDFKVYKKRIQEMQELIKTNQAAVCSPAIIDWLMKCIELPATRWDGLYELNPQSDFMSYYDRGELACKDSYIRLEHRRKLFDVLTAVDTLSYSDIMLADITKGINDTVLLQFLKKQLLLTENENGYFYMAKNIMDHITALTGNNELLTLLQEFDKIYFNYDEKSKLESKRLYKKFIEKMQSCDLKSVPATGAVNSV